MKGTDKQITVGKILNRVYQAINRPCLGIELRKKDGHVLIQPKEL